MLYKIRLLYLQKKPTEDEENRRRFNRFLSETLITGDTILTYKQNSKKYLLISRENAFKVIVELVFSPSEEDPIGTRYYAWLKFEKSISENEFVYHIDILEKIK